MSGQELSDKTSFRTCDSGERYQHHHERWVRARLEGDDAKASRHLYALRAHLHNLGWLAPEYDKPGYGVRT